MLSPSWRPTCAVQNDTGLAGNIILVKLLVLSPFIQSCLLRSEVWTVESPFAGGYLSFSFSVNSK